MKTFVHHDGALGDVLLSLTCLQALRAGSRRIHLACRGNVSRLLMDAGAVDEASSSDGALFASLYSAAGPRLRTFLSGFERAFVFTAEVSSSPAAAILTVIPDTRAIRTIPPDGTMIHAARYRLSQLEPHASVSDNFPVLHVPPEKAEEARSLLAHAGHCPGAGLIAVHPGSGGRPKCWPRERYFELIERLQAGSDALAVLFTGEAEDGEIRQAVSRYARGRKNVFHADGLELTSAAALLSCSRLYIGNDSGFSHLAGALGCTAIVLFGPTNPVLWRPLGPRVETVSAGSPGPMEWITVDEVLAKIGSVAPGALPRRSAV